MEKLIEDILDMTRSEKRKNVVLLLGVAVEVVKRCPYLAETPREEQRELLKILKEREFI